MFAGVKSNFRKLNLESHSLSTGFNVAPGVFFGIRLPSITGSGFRFPAGVGIYAPLVQPTWLSRFPSNIQCSSSVLPSFTALRLSFGLIHSARLPVSLISPVKFALTSRTAHAFHLAPSASIFDHLKRPSNRRLAPRPSAANPFRHFPPPPL